jgi:hypothetical protein
MSEQFRVGFSTEEYGWYYFNADSKEHAEELVEQLQEGEIDPEELPDFYKKVNGGGDDIISVVERLGEN